MDVTLVKAPASIAFHRPMGFGDHAFWEAKAARHIKIHCDLTE
jgi:hypothetical protein